MQTVSSDKATSRPFGLTPETCVSAAVVAPPLLLGTFAVVVIGGAAGSVWAGLVAAYSAAGLAAFGPFAGIVARVQSQAPILGPTLGWLFLVALVVIARKTRLRTKALVCGLFMWTWTFVGCLALMALAS